MTTTAVTRPLRPPPPRPSERDASPADGVDPFDIAQEFLGADGEPLGHEDSTSVGLLPYAQGGAQHGDDAEHEAEIEVDLDEDGATGLLPVLPSGPPAEDFNDMPTGVHRMPVKPVDSEIEELDIELVPDPDDSDDEPTGVHRLPGDPGAPPAFGAGAAPRTGGLEPLIMEEPWVAPDDEFSDVTLEVAQRGPVPPQDHFAAPTSAEAQEWADINDAPTGVRPMPRPPPPDHFAPPSSAEKQEWADISDAPTGVRPMPRPPPLDHFAAPTSAEAQEWADINDAPTGVRTMPRPPPSPAQTFDPAGDINDLPTGVRPRPPPPQAAPAEDINDLPTGVRPRPLPPKD